MWPNPHPAHNPVYLGSLCSTLLIGWVSIWNRVYIGRRQLILAFGPSFRSGFWNRVFEPGFWGESSAVFGSGFWAEPCDYLILLLVCDSDLMNAKIVAEFLTRMFKNVLLLWILSNLHYIVNFIFCCRTLLYNFSTYLLNSQFTLIYEFHKDYNCTTLYLVLCNAWIPV